MIIRDLHFCRLSSIISSTIVSLIYPLTLSLLPPTTTNKQTGFPNIYMNLFYKICRTCLKHDVVLKDCLFTSCSGMADLISHQFTEPGLYHYVFNMADLSQFKGCVAVKPQPTEHVMGIHNGQFKPCRYYLNVLCGK